MKKIIALVLCLSALLLLVACASDKDGKNGDGYVFVAKNGVEIAIGAELDPIIDEMGKYINYDEAPSCAGQGISKFYTYAGIDIESYEEDGEHYVYMITLIDDTVKTKEGIRVGDKKDEVIKAYGDPTEEESDGLYYESGNMCLQFILRNGKVSQIQYVLAD